MARPSTPLISRAAAAQAALDVIDEVGLARFSLNHVARKLGVSSPSFYHYFQDKDELLEEVVRLLFLGLPELKDGLGLPELKRSELPFEERMVNLCVAARRAILKHPNAAVLVLQYFPRRLLLQAYEDAAEANPYPPQFHMVILEGTDKLMFGSALFGAAARARGVDAMPAFKPDRFPAVARALRHNPFADDEKLLEETLRMFFLGAAERYRRGALGQPVNDTEHLFERPAPPPET
ncbi:MAG: TetR/AcrR family transcriptional regulator [Bordetella sp.]|nr:TetR/AcrR family transcriptional regulator [Bordetella sp.]